MADNIYITRNSIVSFSFRLIVDGELIAESTENEPIKIIHGKGEIISGLERELLGMRIGERKHISLVPVHAFGELNPELIITIPKKGLKPNLPIYSGTVVEIRDKSGQNIEGKIINTSGDNIQVDTNHPLAGKRLELDIQIMDVIPPSVQASTINR